MIKISSVLVLVAAMFASCSNTSKIKETQKQNQDQAQIVSVEFVGDGVIKNAEGTVSLFAVSKNIADVPATLIMEEKIDASKFPFMIRFELPEKHEQLIKPAVKEGEPIKYYVSIEWDSNGDGQVGAGDIVIDYDKKFPDVVIGETTQIFVRESK